MIETTDGRPKVRKNRKPGRPAAPAGAATSYAKAAVDAYVLHVILWLEMGRAITPPPRPRALPPPAPPYANTCCSKPHMISV